MTPPKAATTKPHPLRFCMIKCSQSLCPAQFIQIAL